MARIAEIAGHGPVDDTVIAQLLSQANLALLVTDTGGAPLWYGRTRRLATVAQRNAVIATSNGHCCFPGCTITAERCEIDHLTGWTAGGRTDIDNLGLLCSFHNRLKHRWNLTVTRAPDGTLRWHHPNGSEIHSRYQTTTGPPVPGSPSPGADEDVGPPGPERSAATGHGRGGGPRPEASPPPDELPDGPPGTALGP